MRFCHKRKAQAVLGVFGFLVISVMLAALPASGQSEEKVERARISQDVDRQAKHLFEKAMELMEYKQYERGLAMLNTVVRDNEGSILAHRANMAMGKHFLDQGKPKESLSFFLLLTRLLKPKPDEQQSEEEVELFREALFQAGFAQYKAGQYSGAFSLLRRLIEVGGKSKWANMAYFYIGMSHYNLKNWNKAIEALSMVGTVVEDEVDELGRIEIGQRFYAKITDDDIPVMRKLKRPIRAQVTVSSGDSEILEGVPVAGKKAEMLVSAPTEVGAPKLKPDGKLQLVGGDTLTVTYLDDSTLDGRKSVPRTGKVRAVSTGSIGFVLGDYDAPAYLAFPGQPQAIILKDADLDVSPAAESVQVTVRSLYKVAAKAAAAELKDTLDMLDVREEAGDQWKERDRITVTLMERGSNALVRSGAFIGKVELAAMEEGVVPDPSDEVLHCYELDELSVSYTDKVHIYGDEPRENESRIKVSGSVRSGVSANNFVVSEPLLKARKSSVEAQGLVGLGLIYKDLGLDHSAAQRGREALGKVNPIIMGRAIMPSDLVEKAFQTKWEAELLEESFGAATETCLAFNRLYPESVLADQALMTLGRTLALKGQYAEAVDVYGQVLRLQNPISAAEAQFRIGETLQKQAEEKSEAANEHNSKWGTSGLNSNTALSKHMSGAVAAYRKCFEVYSDSSYAAESVRRVVSHYVAVDDNAQAAALLENIFSSYPDAEFLDQMLMLWAKVAEKLGDKEMSRQKLEQLISDYPQSDLVSEATSKLGSLGMKEE